MKEDKASIHGYLGGGRGGLADDSFLRFGVSC